MHPTPTHAPIRQPLLLATLIAASLALGACKSNESKPEEPAPQPTAAQAAATPAPLPECKEEPASKTKSKTKSKQGKDAKSADCAPKGSAKAPAAAAPAPAASTAGGYDLSKNKPVTDSTKVVAGEGTQVKGINDWEGEITGIPAANSRFTKLKIGMSLQQAIDIAGAPTDQGAYVTGKAFIPFYFGSDRARWEAVFKGQGRLIFATQAGFGTGQYLVWIIHNANEPGYR